MGLHLWVRVGALLFAAFGNRLFADSDVSLTLRNAASADVGICPGALVDIETNLQLDSDAYSRYGIDFQSAGVQVAAGMIVDTSLSRLRTVVPPSLPPGNTVVRLLYDKAPVASATITLAAAAPGLFTGNYIGEGTALAEIHRAGGISLNRLTNPVLPGELVTLWLTGLGDLSRSEVAVEIGGSPVEVTYAGHHATPGLDQVNIRIASDSHTGCYVPVVVRVDQTEGNIAALAISPEAGACAHPLGISYTDLVTIDEGGTIIAGSFTIASAGGFFTIGGLPGNDASGDMVWAESADVSLFHADAWALFALAGFQEPLSHTLSCRMVRGVTRKGGGSGPGEQEPPRELDPGKVSLLGPEAKVLRLEGDYPRYYWSDNGAAPLFTPGIWQITSTGGEGIMKIQQSFAMPPPVRPTNSGDLTVVRRDRDTAVRWNPSGYLAGEVMTVLLANPPTPEAVYCRQYAWKGELILPSNLLRRLQPASQGFLSLDVSPLNQARPLFVLHRTNGETAPAVVSYSSGQVFPVRIE